MLSRLAEYGLRDTVEVISADSRQVYRGMDIGTAKPDLDERRRTPYHLIDVIDPTERFDAGEFVTACDRLIPEISSRGKRAVISGGTAFYIKAYLFGLPGTPRATEEVRRTLETRAAEEGLDELRRELRRVDPTTEGRIAPNDRYRILRALEVWYTAGRPLSSYEEPSTPRRGIEALLIGLRRDRRALYRRIDERVGRMFAEGLADEVKRLLDGGVDPSVPGFQAIGYREFVEVGGLPPWTDDELAEIERLIARNSRRYAKRQELFFRRLPGVRWIDADDVEAIVAAVREKYDGHDRRGAHDSIVPESGR